MDELLLTESQLLQYLVRQTDLTSIFAKRILTTLTKPGVKEGKQTLKFPRKSTVVIIGRKTASVRRPTNVEIFKFSVRRTGQFNVVQTCARSKGPRKGTGSGGPRGPVK